MVPNVWPRQRFAAFLAVASLVLVAAGCGSSSSSSTSTASSSGSSSSGVAEAKSIVARDSKVSPSIGVTEPLQARPATGKRVYYVECCAAAGAFLAQEAKAAGAALGWEVKIIATNGTSESLKAGWEQAASDPKVSAVLGNGVPKVLIQGALEKLEQKKAVAITWANVDEPSGSLIAVLANKPFIQKVGEMLAAWMVAESNGKANTAIFTVPSLPILPPLTAEFTSKVKQLCSSCSAEVVPEPITAVGTDMPSRITGYLQAHPSVNYITEGWDDMFIGAPQAINGSGLGSKVTAIGYAPGSTANAGYVKNGEVEKALIPYPYAEVMWRAYDILARHFANQSIKQSAESPLPLTIYNAASITNPNKLITITPNYQQQYETLWKVK
jgi:ABC-type sugar transport system substrate-binding protein